MKIFYKINEEENYVNVSFWSILKFIVLIWIFNILFATGFAILLAIGY